MLRAIILEDNISYSWDYEMILESLEIEVSGVYKSWRDALPEIKKQLPDFMIVDLFLDNNEKGMEFINQIKDYFIPTIICTGYPEQSYMDQALDYGVHAFMAKPIDKSAFTFQVKKLKRKLQTAKDQNSVLKIKDKKNLLKIPFEEISRIVIEGNYASIFLISGKRYVLKTSLKRLQMKLSQELFIQSHRSTIVNLKLIGRIDLNRNKVIMKCGAELELGNKFRNSVKAAYH